MKKLILLSFLLTSCASTEVTIIKCFKRYEYGHQPTYYRTGNSTYKSYITTFEENTYSIVESTKTKQRKEISGCYGKEGDVYILK